MAALLVGASVVAWSLWRHVQEPTGRTLRVATSAAPARAEDRPAPMFELPALAGTGRISLAEVPEGVVVLNFWASWCDPCRQEARVLESLWRKYRSRGVQFVGINHLDGRTAAIEFQREFGVTYPSGFDPEGSVASAYGLVGLPTTLIIQETRVRYSFLGAVEEASLRSALDSVLAEKD